MNFSEPGLFQTIFEQLPEPRILLRTDSPVFTIVFTNASHKRATNTSDVTGKSLWEVFDPNALGGDGPAIIKEALDTVIHTSRPMKIPGFLYSRTDEQGNITEQNWWELEYSPVLCPAGTVIYILGTAYNVTREFSRQGIIDDALLQAKVLLREQALNIELSELNGDLANANEELNKLNDRLTHSREFLAKMNEKLEESVLSRTRSLAESEARFRNLFEQAPLGLALLRGPDLVIELANQSILKIWGRSLEEVIGKTQRESRPELEGQPIIANLEKVYASGNSLTLNESKAFTLKEGIRTEGYFDMLYQPFYDSEGKTNSILVVLTDVSEKVGARKAAEKTQEALKLALAAGGLGTWKANLMTNQMSASERTRTICGIPEGTFMNPEHAFDMISDEHKDRIKLAIQHAIHSKASFIEDYSLEPLDGTAQRWVNIMGCAEYDDEGKPLNYSGTIMDITERKLDDIRKNDFISMVSHELKTPLTSLKGYAQLATARLSELDNQFIGYALEKINQQATKMTDMVNSFLDISRLEASQIHLEPSIFSLNELILETLNEVILTAGGHQFYFHPCPAVEVMADCDKIGQVLTNLFSNAIKYSAQGTRIEIYCTPENGSVKVMVKDQGIGIRHEDLAKLFTRFYRIENDQTRNISGFGLGLYLSAEILHRHKGRIWVESDPGKGSAFYFSIPLT